VLESDIGRGMKETEYARGQAEPFELIVKFGVI
jgi:hypothetical protein